MDRMHGVFVFDHAFRALSFSTFVVSNQQTNVSHQNLWFLFGRKSNLLDVVGGRGSANFWEDKIVVLQLHLKTQASCLWLQGSAMSSDPMAFRTCYCLDG